MDTVQTKSFLYGQQVWKSVYTYNKEGRFLESGT